MASEDKRIYHIDIELDARLMNARAAEIVPQLIREFAETCKIKMALVTSTQSFTFEATVSEGPDYIEKPLFTPENDDDAVSSEDLY